MPILNRLTANKTAAQTPRLPEALPSDSRHDAAKYTAERISSKYTHLTDQMSSPTRRGLEALATATNEAILFRREVQIEGQNREARLRRVANARKRRTVKSSDQQFATPVVFNELIQREAQRRRDEAAKERAKARREYLRLRRKEEADHLQVWRAAGRTHEGRKVTKKEYLDLVGFNAEYIPLDTGNEAPAWFVDTAKQEILAGSNDDDDDVNFVLDSNPRPDLPQPTFDNDDDLAMRSSPPLPPSSPCPQVARPGDRDLPPRVPDPDTEGGLHVLLGNF